MIAENEVSSRKHSDRRPGIQQAGAITERTVGQHQSKSGSLHQAHESIHLIPAFLPHPLASLTQPSVWSIQILIEAIMASIKIKSDHFLSIPHYPHSFSGTLHLILHQANVFHRQLHSIIILTDVSLSELTSSHCIWVSSILDHISSFFPCCLQLALLSHRAYSF